jgi:hypothetical protein
MIHYELNDLTTVYEKTVAAVPYLFSAFRIYEFTECSILTWIERTIAKGTILAKKMTRIIRTIQVRAYASPFDLLFYLFLDAIHIRPAFEWRSQFNI